VEKRGERFALELKKFLGIYFLKLGQILKKITKGGLKGGIERVERRQK
jgi:hypothetical protein